MSAYTLDSIRKAADAKYGATEIAVDEKTTVRLLNPLRLTKERRNDLMNIQDRLTGEDGDEPVDQIEVFRDAIRLVSDDEASAEVLIDAIGDDLALLAEIFTTYTEGTSAGEASASAN